MSNDFRKGLVNHEVNSSMLPIIGIETLIFSVGSSYLADTYLGWNWFATGFIAFIVLLILTFTPIYHLIGILFSIGWGYLGYKVISFITAATGGGTGLVITLGIIGFIMAFLLTLGARIGGKEYLDDIGN
ncbi:hypothetical protein MHZ92_07775 [Sporosarcina sp. ACRSL]|uniref:hypothetical protein n=1 Tax=Sporosarcina sp. ACRSL TaxID=2918215 RepID=UPI001EF5992D|nr:hypothetical protein [Sporosarcina sp. ACRSL]MCG7344026.1 hypothetical protein [Sporosarcina sp. ACRSL]